MAFTSHSSDGDFGIWWLSSPEETFETREYEAAIADYAVMQSEINIAIGKKSPEVYIEELQEQCNGGEQKFGGITDLVRERHAGPGCIRDITRCSSRSSSSLTRSRRLLSGGLHFLIWFGIFG